MTDKDVLVALEVYEPYPGGAKIGVIGLPAKLFTQNGQEVVEVMFHDGVITNLVRQK